MGMFVDHNLWPPPPSEPPTPPSRRMTDAEEKRLGWAMVVLGIVLFAGPLAGSSVVEALAAAVGSVWRAVAG